MAAKHFLGIDIGTSTIKLGEFVSVGNEGLALVNFGQVPLEMDPTSDEDRAPFIISALKKLTAKKNLKTRQVAISVSGQMVLTRFMPLPPVAEEAKLRQAVYFEAEKSAPFPMEEVVWDFQAVGGKAEGSMEVLMVSIKNEIIESLNSCFEKIGFEVDVVDVAPIAIYNAALYNYDLSQGCTLLLDIGARITNLIFVESNKVYIRPVSIAGNTITQSIAQEFEIPFSEAEDLKRKDGFVGLGGAYEEPEMESTARLSKIIRNVMTRLHAEVSRSISFYKNQQNGTSPKKLLLLGGSSTIPYADHFFNEKMEIEVDYFNPFQNIQIQVPPDELEKAAHAMAEVVGLGLRQNIQCPIEINLVPPSITKRHQFAKKIPLFTASMIGILCIVWSWWLYYWRITQVYQGHLDGVKIEVANLEKIKADIKQAEKSRAKVQEESAQVQQVIEARYFWLGFFEDLNQLVPKDIWITKLVPKSGENGETEINFGKEIVQEGRGAPKLPGPAAPTARQIKKITAFEIQGLCLNNPNASDPLETVDVFREKLSKSPYFLQEKPDMPNRETPRLGDWTFPFTLKVKLKTPIPY